MGSVLSLVPSSAGRFGPYGGRYVPETLMSALMELEEAYEAARKDAEFYGELSALLKHYVGRPSPLYRAERLTSHCGGATIYLKREDLNHTGAHKINNTLGQVLLAMRMGKRRVIAETGAGMHGVATATAAALFGLECDVYMGTEDMRRQAPNVARMEMMGTRVIGVDSGSKTLKDAINEAMRDWMASVQTTHYVFGSVAGPHPFPRMVRDFQSVIGRELRQQMTEREGRLPHSIIACVGGGSNAAGIFFPFIDEPKVQLIGVEAGGYGLDSNAHAATLAQGTPGVLHGSFSYCLQDEDGQTLPVHSVSAGLDYPGVGPEHSYWRDEQRVEYVSVTDEQALATFDLLCLLEGIIPALESAHAVAHAIRTARDLPSDHFMVINLSGRGDKDVAEVERLRKKENA